MLLLSSGLVSAQSITAPARPTGLTAASSHDSVTLTWDDPGDASIAHYEILRRDVALHAIGVFFTIEANTGSADTTYTDRTVDADARYVYRVKAVNAHGTSQWSSYASAKTPQAPPDGGNNDDGNNDDGNNDDGDNDDGNSDDGNNDDGDNDGDNDGGNPDDGDNDGGNTASRAPTVTGSLSSGMTLAGDPAVWRGTLSVGRLGVYAGWSAFGSLGEINSNSFVWNRKQYNIGALFATDDGKVQLSLSTALPESVVLRLGTLELTSTDAEITTGYVVTAYIWTTGDVGWNVGDSVEASITPVARDGAGDSGTFELACDADELVEGTALNCTLAYDGTGEPHWPAVALLSRPDRSGSVSLRGTDADVAISTVTQLRHLVRGEDEVAGEQVEFVIADWNGYDIVSSPVQFSIDVTADEIVEGDEAVWLSVGYAPGNHGHPSPSRKDERSIDTLVASAVELAVAEPSDDASLGHLQARAPGSDEDWSWDVPVSASAYRVVVGHEVVEVVVSPTPSHAKASATVQGLPNTPSGVTVSLAVGSNPILVVVTAEDGSASTYTLDFVRQTGSSVVSVDGFTLSCPRSISAGTTEHTCVLRSTADIAKEWPVVAVLTSSLDERPAALTRVDPAQTAGIRLSDDPADLENYNYGYGELLPRTAAGDYRVFHYERFDPTGTAAAGAERDVSLSIDDGADIEASQLFHVALAPSDATGLAELVANKIPITINPAAGTGHDDTADDPADGQQESATSSRPSIHFTKEAHELFPRSLLWHPGSGDIDLDWTYTGEPDRRRHFYFDVVGLDIAHVEPSDLRFKVEAEPDKDAHQYKFCHREPKFQNPATDDGCHPVGVGVLPQSGQLHMYIDGEYSHRRTMQFFLSDYPRHQVELSAQDTHSGLKIHRDVYIEPPAEAADCDVFPDLNLERYNCLFLGELLPQSLVTPQEHLDELPKLVQPSDNYRLVFSEEFDHCDNGEELNPDIWSEGAAPCKTDGENVSPCQHFIDGQFYMTAAEECPSAYTEFKSGSTKRTARLRTVGNVRFKYGYIETRITIPKLAAHGYTSNLSIVLGNANRQRIHHHERYGIVVDSIEKLTTTHSMEIDLFEFIAGRRSASFHAHQYRNWFARYFVPELQPIVTHRNILLCYAGDKIYTVPRIYQLDTGRAVAGACDREFLENTPVTMTIGLEWTPRGYRSFLKIEDFHDDWEVTRKENIGIGYYPIQSTLADGTVRWKGRNVAYEGSERDKFFEFLIPGDPDSVLEQAGISHVPADIYIGNSQAVSTGGRSAKPGLLIDYIRVFQPANNYDDMDPVFQ